MAYSLRALAVLAIATACAAASPAVAQSASSPDAPANGNHVVIGGGAVFDRAPFKGEETRIFPIPVISIRQGAFYFETTELGVSLSTDADDVQLGADVFVVARNRPGRDRSKLTADGGGRVWIASPLGKLSAEVRRDVTDTFSGTEVIGRYSYAINAGKLAIVPAAQISWLDRKAANWMYGITPAQRATMIAKHRSVILPVAPINKHVFNVGGDLTLSYTIDAHWSVLGVASGAYLGKPIRNSAAVGEPWQATIVAGVAYKF